MPATWKFTVDMPSQRCCAVVREGTSFSLLYRMRIVLPAAQGGALNSATRGCVVALTTGELPVIFGDTPNSTEAAAVLPVVRFLTTISNSKLPSDSTGVQASSL